MIVSSMATSSRGSVVTMTMTLPSSTIELGTREALRQVFGAPHTPAEYRCCFGTAWPPRFGRFSIWDLAAGKTASKLWDSTLKDLTMDLLNNITTVGDTDAAVHAWMVGKNADRARPTIVICSTAVDFRVEARRLLKGRVSKYNFGVMTVSTRLSRESGLSIFVDKERSNVLPSLVYGTPISVKLGGRSATIGGEIRLDKERYGLTVAHVFDEGDWNKNPDENIVNLEFDEYSDDEWNDSEASFDDFYSGSPSHDKQARFTEESRLESELKEAYYILSKHPPFVRKSASQRIGSLEEPPKLHKAHDWALIKIDAPNEIDDNRSRSSLGTGTLGTTLSPTSQKHRNVVERGADLTAAEAFAAGVVAATFAQERTSMGLDGGREYHDWPAKLNDDPVTVEAFATGVVAATEFVLVARDKTLLPSSKRNALHVEPAAQSSFDEALPHSGIAINIPSYSKYPSLQNDERGNLSKEDLMRRDEMRMQDAHDRIRQDATAINPWTHMPPPEPSLADLHTRAQSEIALPHRPRVKGDMEPIRGRPNTEDAGDGPALPSGTETRRAIAVPCIYAEEILDETVWVATGRGALLKGRGVPSTCILNMNGQGFVEAFVVSLVDDAIPGDCGSWVVNQSTDKLIGMLIATSRPFGLAYLVPAFQIMADLKGMFPDREVYLPQEEDLRKLESQYASYEQAAAYNKHHKFEDYTEYGKTDEEGRSFQEALANELPSSKDKAEVYIVRCERGIYNDSIHTTAESAHRRMEDLIRKGDKSAMVTVLTMAHGKVSSPEDRALAVVKLAAIYRKRGLLEEAEKIERHLRILQTHEPYLKGTKTPRSGVSTLLSSATTQSRSSHTSSFTGSRPSSATTQTIENQHSSPERNAPHVSGIKRGDMEPAVFDPESIKQRYSMSAKKGAGGNKQGNIEPAIFDRESIKQRYSMSDGRERPRFQAPTLGFSKVYDWLLKLVCSIPTVGFNMKRIQKGHVTLKCWDLGGQLGFRAMWERFSRGANAIVFIVDAADPDVMPVAKDELHALLEKPSVEGIPLLVLGNKCDLQEHLPIDDLIEALDLKSIPGREVSCYGISAKEETNLDAILQWLIARTSKAR